MINCRLRASQKCDNYDESHRACLPKGSKRGSDTMDGSYQSTWLAGPLPGTDPGVKRIDCQRNSPGSPYVVKLQPADM